MPSYGDNSMDVNSILELGGGGGACEGEQVN